MGSVRMVTEVTVRMVKVVTVVRVVRVVRAHLLLVPLEAPLEGALVLVDEP